jgi:hypothetical protein
MSIVLDLPKKLVKELNSEAAQQNQDLNEYLTQLIQRGRTARFSSTAEILQYWEKEGLIGNRPAHTNSQKVAQRLRKQSNTRNR